MSNPSVSDSSGASSTPPVNYRMTGMLRGLNQGDLQSELFESLLKLPAFTLQVAQPPEKPEERRGQEFVDGAKRSVEGGTEREESGDNQEDQKISLTDGPLSLIPQPAIAICYCRSPDKGVSEANSEAEGTFLVDKGTPTKTAQPISGQASGEDQLAKGQSDVPLPNSLPLTEEGPLPKELVQPAGSVLSDVEQKTVPETNSWNEVNRSRKTGLRSGRAPSTPEEGAHSEGATVSGRVPVKEQGDAKESAQAEGMRDVPQAIAGLESTKGQSDERPTGRRELQLERNRLEREPNERSSKDEAPRSFTQPVGKPDYGSAPNEVVSPSDAVNNPLVAAANIPEGAVATASSPTLTVAPTVAGTSVLAGVTPTTNGKESKAGSVEPTGNAIAGIRGTSTSATDVRGARESSMGGSSLTPRQEVRLVQRLLRGFEQLSNGEGQVKLRLHPPELGSLQMTVKMEGQVMTAHLEVENALAKDALTQNVQQLRDSLSEQGIRIERFDVQVVSDVGQNNLSGESQTQSNGMGQADQQAREQAQRQRQAQWRSNQIESNTRPVSEPTSARRVVVGRGLDLTA